MYTVRLKEIMLEGVHLGVKVINLFKLSFFTDRMQYDCVCPRKNHVIQKIMQVQLN